MGAIWPDHTTLPFHWLPVMDESDAGSDARLPETDLMVTLCAGLSLRLITTTAISAGLPCALRVTRAYVYNLGSDDSSGS